MTHTTFAAERKAVVVMLQHLHGNGQSKPKIIGSSTSTKVEAINEVIERKRLAEWTKRTRHHCDWIKSLRSKIEMTSETIPEARCEAFDTTEDCCRTRIIDKKRNKNESRTTKIGTPIRICFL